MFMIMRIEEVLPAPFALRTFRSSRIGVMVVPYRRRGGPGAPKGRSLPTGGYTDGGAGGLRRGLGLALGALGDPRDPGKFYPPLRGEAPPAGEFNPPLREGLPPAGEFTPPLREGLPPAGDVKSPLRERLPPAGERQSPLRECVPPAGG